MREQAGLTQRQRAAKLKTNHVFVHKFETGERRVDVAEFMDWCVACNVDPSSGFERLRALLGI